ncbi:MAG: hypothetical protein LBR44_03125 [Clostridiales Family XIII bacterium]|jgi:hypothetical protein|nr:hypothetical protein [Clostridiales Family XIII bacterium]
MKRAAAILKRACAIVACVIIGCFIGTQSVMAYDTQDFMWYADKVLEGAAPAPAYADNPYWQAYAPDPDCLAHPERYDHDYTLFRLFTWLSGSEGEILVYAAQHYTDREDGAEFGFGGFRVWTIEWRGGEWALTGRNPVKP